MKAVFKWTGIVLGVTAFWLTGLFVGLNQGYKAGGEDAIAYLVEPSTPQIKYFCGSLAGKGKISVLNWVGEQTFIIDCTGTS